MRKLKSIEDGWRSYNLLVLHNDLSPVNQKINKVSFYAGVHLILSGMRKALEADIPKEDIINNIRTLSAEVNEFVEQL